MTRTPGLRAWAALAVLTLAVTLLAIDSTVLALAIPSLSTELSPTASQLLWIGDIYSFTLAGLLVTLQARAFAYLEELDMGDVSEERLREMLQFVEQDLHCHSDAAQALDGLELLDYLYCRLNRPMRVCGMVRNVGEPGGGPFLAHNPDGSVSLQILESSQIDMSDPAKKALFEKGTHFNPVDLVCGLRDYNGEKFNLPDFVDPATGFISQKSKDGRELLALELPGLWNGAMSDWNTVFVEVPLTTFTPVKTVNDLFRPQHQA